MRANEPDVVYQVFADEVVIVNLSAGNYYSLTKAGAEIFCSAACGLSEEEISSTLSERWGLDRDSSSLTVSSLLGRLLSEGLLVQSDGPPSSVPAFPVPSLPYEEPVLQAYEEMQSLLLLDPIHDVDELGWPHKKQE